MQGNPYLSVDQVFARAGVNRADFEALTWGFYDFLTYPAAGAATLSFFTAPATGAKTKEQTNLTLPSQIPANQFFHIQCVEVYFSSGVVPSTFGAEAALLNVNDEFAVTNSGFFQLVIGSKPYVEVAPLLRLPPKKSYNLGAAVADATTAAADLQTRVGIMQRIGEPYHLGPGFILQANQNFEATISYPNGAIATPSTVAGEIGVVLSGVLYRRSQ